MGRRRFTAEFKREAVKLAVQPDAVVSRIAEDLGLHANVLRKWVKEFAAGRWEAKPGLQLRATTSLFRRLTYRIWCRPH